MSAAKPFPGLDAISLSKGNHPSRGQGVCVMEAATWLRGQPHSDAPKCVASPIRAALINWNDNLPDDASRDRLLKPLLADGVIFDTATTPEDDHQRSLIALDWIVREYLPTWMDLTPALRQRALELRALPALSDDTAKVAGELVRMAAVDCNAAWDAAWAAAGAAARAAARDAAWAAAWAAAGDAARAAAWAAAWAAAGDAAGAAAWDAAWDAAWAAAGAAARDAAGDAAWDALKPTVAKLQESAVQMVRRMCAVGRAS